MSNVNANYPSQIILPISPLNQNVFTSNNQTGKSLKKILQAFCLTNYKQKANSEGFYKTILTGLCRFLKSFKHRKIPQRGLISVDLRIEQEFELWKQIAWIYKENPEEVNRIIEKCAVVFRKNSINPKNFYCQKYENLSREIFSSPVTQQAFAPIVNLSFYRFSCKNACKKFKIRCCSNSAHNETCDYKWSVIKYYLESYFINDLIKSNLLIS